MSQGAYPKSLEVLGQVLGEENLKGLLPYLHVYDGTAASMKPRAKHITIYWVGKAVDRMVLRTESVEDIVLSSIGDEAVPTILFRKFKAVMLRDYAKLVRETWDRYSEKIKDKGLYEGDFMKECSIAVGVKSGGGEMAQGRCMKCPIDVLMGATSAKVDYNIQSRFMGDSAYALTPDIKVRTGNAVDEVTHTTIMLGTGVSEEAARTGALFRETHVEPGTLFVGKVVLPMISPPELIYILWLLDRTVRVGARTSIYGTLEVSPTVIIGDTFEVGSSYAVAERSLGKRNFDEVKGLIINYVKGIARSSSVIVDVNQEIERRVRSIDPLNEELALELWSVAHSFVKGAQDYVSAGSAKGGESGRK